MWTLHLIQVKHFILVNRQNICMHLAMGKFWGKEMDNCTKLKREIWQTRIEEKKESQRAPGMTKRQKFTYLELAWHN